jgi:hypothetical protein
VGGVMELYKGEKVSELLEEISRLEKILIQHNKDIDPFSMARYEEYCHAYTVLTIAKSQLKAFLFRHHF